MENQAASTSRAAEKNLAETAARARGRAPRYGTARTWRRCSGQDAVQVVQRRCVVLCRRGVQIDLLGVVSNRRGRREFFADCAKNSALALETVAKILETVFRRLHNGRKNRADYSGEDLLNWREQKILEGVLQRRRKVSAATQ